jgi:hypothetical protein
MIQKVNVLCINTTLTWRIILPKISMWKDKKGDDFKFIDRMNAERYDIGGVGIGLHKYLGPQISTVPSTDATKPNYTTQSVTNIQDILFLENRDRKYDTDIYVMRGVYQQSDNDFDLSQFGLFLQTGTVIMTFHYNEMIKTLGRKIMSGDVIEMFNLRDDDVLGVAAALKRFYVVGDCAWASEGFGPTWYPHLWRAKLDPLVDSQEYKDILNQIQVTDSSGPMGTVGNTTPMGDLISTYQKYMDINNAVIQQAEKEVPKSGYDVSKIFSYGTDKDGNTKKINHTADSMVETSDGLLTSDQATYSPAQPQNPPGYLVGDGIAPNDLAVTAGVTFPMNPEQGMYCLRLDFLPNRLFRFNGSRWLKMEDDVRTNLTPGAPDNTTLRNSFANNAGTMTLNNGDVIPERQSLSQALRPKANY